MRVILNDGLSQVILNDRSVNVISNARLNKDDFE